MNEGRYLGCPFAAKNDRIVGEKRPSGQLGGYAEPIVDVLSYKLVKAIGYKALIAAYDSDLAIIGSRGAVYRPSPAPNRKISEKNKLIAIDSHRRGNCVLIALRD
jgi:hypothetical protein